MNNRLAGAAGKVSPRLDMSEQLPQTKKSASSVNAGSSIAGLKPWNQEWVFEGNPKPADDVHPLFGASQGETEFAEMQDALKQIRLAAGMQGVAGPQSMDPGATQVTENNLRSRGDVGVAANVAANQADSVEGAKMAQVAGVLAGNLREQLKAAGASVEDVNVGGGKAGVARKNGPMAGQFAGGSGLSGAEFMGTLSVVRGPSAGAKDQGFMQQDSDSSGNSGGTRSGLAPELKVMSGGKDDKLMSSAPSSFGAVHAASAQPTLQSQPAVQVTGHVVQGSMTQEQLSHEAILGMTNGIKGMSGQGGGEMRIRLKPENLGELHLRIVTQGNEVGIQIQASDDKAKKILQESLGGLKDSLASQSLTLGKVEFSVAQAGSSADARNDARDPNQQQSQSQYNQQSALGQNAGDNRNQRSNSFSYQDIDAVGAKPLAGVAASNSSAALARAAQVANTRSENGRLDVRA